MIFYRIAIFLFTFNLVAGFIYDVPVNQLGNDLDESPFEVGLDGNYTNLNRFQNWTSSAQNVGDVSLGFGDIVGGFLGFVEAFGGATIALPLMLGSMGLPTSFVVVFSSLTWLTYFAGGIQLWTGRIVEK